MIIIKHSIEDVARKSFSFEKEICITLLNVI